ncbi:MAG: DUF1854 domain-containing protein [Capsulimonadaceae bacterium]
MADLGRGDGFRPTPRSRGMGLPGGAERRRSESGKSDRSDWSDPSDDDGYSLRQLDPSEVRLFRSAPDDARVRLTLRGERSWVQVNLSCAFPFTHGGRYIGIQDSAGGDIGVIADVDALDAESAALVRAELTRRYFTPSVRKVITVSEAHGTVTFDVETDRGRRRFVVRNIRDNAYPLGPHRLMITDSAGNRYHFPDIASYGQRTYNVLIKVM